MYCSNYSLSVCFSPPYRIFLEGGLKIGDNLLNIVLPCLSSKKLKAKKGDQVERERAWAMVQGLPVSFIVEWRFKLSSLPFLSKLFIMWGSWRNKCFLLNLVLLLHFYSNFYTVIWFWTVGHIVLQERVWGFLLKGWLLCLANAFLWLWPKYRLLSLTSMFWQSFQKPLFQRTWHVYPFLWSV